MNLAFLLRRLLRLLLAKIDFEKVGGSLSYQLLKVLSQMRLGEFNSYSGDLLLKCDKRLFIPQSIRV